MLMLHLWVQIYFKAYFFPINTWPRTFLTLAGGVYFSGGRSRTVVEVASPRRDQKSPPPPSHPVSFLAGKY